MLLPHGTIVALVDGGNFELYRNTGDEASPELTKQESPRLDTSNHSAGRHHESAKGSHGRHKEDEAVHAAAVIEWLNDQVIGRKIDNLVIIASPTTLGEMRMRYHGHLQRALRKEVAKDLVGSHGPQIIAALREI